MNKRIGFKPRHLLLLLPVLLLMILSAGFYLREARAQALRREVVGKWQATSGKTRVEMDTKGNSLEIRANGQKIHRAYRFVGPRSFVLKGPDLPSNGVLLDVSVTERQLILRGVNAQPNQQAVTFRRIR